MILLPGGSQQSLRERDWGSIVQVERDLWELSWVMAASPLGADSIEYYIMKGDQSY